MWTGFYAGLNVGGTWANNNTASATATPLYVYPYYLPPLSDSQFMPGLHGSTNGYTGPLSTNSSSGFLGGVQAGYNEVVFNKFVIGAETDFQGFAVSQGYGPVKFASVNSDVPTIYNGQTLVVPNTTYVAKNASKSVDYLGTVRLRAGYLVMPNLLVYGTGGLAYGGAKVSSMGVHEDETQTVEFGPGYISKSSALVGWTAGGGAEWMFAQNWSVKAEYLYYNLGSLSTSDGGYITNIWAPGAYAIPSISYGTVLALAQSRVSSNSIDGNIVRAGVNYHFNLANIVPDLAKF